ncbi:flagellar hook-length control protein FliK [Paenibacillus sp. BK720]|uniref:flagellar hook-length control protein FliK n=1 Tax=Paenibacillus sp. BK720 TaxID=2587092 RepID=UPI00141F4D1C|nr:flagellar hook-length control protein FliK [Paenibacillus sp. BK720]NIK68810.1 hypothetical protein [Paenibacillus sp. BK720]
MNIGQLVRGLLGESSGSGDTRKLELKPGQVVRGLVLQLLENNEATVQINGVQVRAVLELPLEPGKFAMLQVQPQSAGGLLVLKQVENQAGLEDALKDWLKQSGLPDQEWASNILKDLRKDGVTMSHDTFAALKAAAEAMPQGANAEEWMQAAAAGLKRGLPMSGGTVGALQQVMFGRPPHELLDTLQQQLAAIAGEAFGDDAGAAAPRAASGPQALPQLAARLAALLAEGAALQSAAPSAEPPAAAAPRAPAAADAGAAAQRAEGTGAGGQAAPAAAAQASAAEPAEQGAEPQGAGGQAAPAAAAQASAAEPAEQGAEPQGARPGAAAGGSTSSSGNWLGQMMKWMGVDYENQLSKQLPVPPAQGSVQPQEQDTPMAGNGHVNDSVTADEPIVTRSANGVADSLTRRQAAEGRLETRQSPNTQQEQAAGQQPEQADAAAPRDKDHKVVQNDRFREPQVTVQHLSTDLVKAEDNKPAAQESLKSTLLAIAASSDAPPALRETAQQLVQQITGQQLLLSPERNGAVFSHLTMFVPLNGPDGNQTASVHIQTRRGRQGQLDAENCRLLFDLSMKTLGPTLVDVNVMDKIVSLTLWNDHPAIAALVDSARTEITASLNQAGYQLLSLRATPTRADSDEGEGVKRIMPDPAQFVNTRYKGVDIRA